MNRTFRHSAACMMLSAFAAAFTAQAASPVDEAQALLKQGDLDGALKRVDRFLSGNPQDAEGRFTRALILVKQSKTADAIKFYQDKVDTLQKNLGDLEKIVAQKSQNARVVEEGRRPIGL